MGLITIPRLEDKRGIAETNRNLITPPATSEQNSNLSELSEEEKVADRDWAEYQRHLKEKGSETAFVTELAGDRLSVWRPAAERGNSAAQVFLGQYEEDPSVAVQWFRSEAQHMLGKLYSAGRGVRQDHAEAAVWFRRAADQGDACSRLNLGLMFAEGRGVPQSDSEAANWYR